MTDPDELLRDHGAWRYICHRPRCSYVTKPLPVDEAEYVGRIHQHRHAVGRAGTHKLHHPEKE